MGVFEHDMTMAELRSRGIVPRMSVVPLIMLLSIKLKPDGSFDKAKGRQVAASHPGHMKKGIHYAAVFSASPAIAFGRILKAASVQTGVTLPPAPAQPPRPAAGCEWSRKFRRNCSSENAVACNTESLDLDPGETQIVEDGCVGQILCCR